MFGRYNPRPEGIWERWKFDWVAEGEEQVVEEQPWWERHNIKLPRTIYKLKEVATLDKEAVSRPRPRCFHVAAYQASSAYIRLYSVSHRCISRAGCVALLGCVAAERQRAHGGDVRDIR